MVHCTASSGGISLDGPTRPGPFVPAPSRGGGRWRTHHTATHTSAFRRPLDPGPTSPPRPPPTVPTPPYPYPDPDPYPHTPTHEGGAHTPRAAASIEGGAGVPSAISLMDLRGVTDSPTRPLTATGVVLDTFHRAGHHHYDNDHERAALPLSQPQSFISPAPPVMLGPGADSTAIIATNDVPEQNIRRRRIEADDRSDDVDVHIDIDSRHDGDGQRGENAHTPTNQATHTHTYTYTHLGHSRRTRARLEKARGMDHHDHDDVDKDGIKASEPLLGENENLKVTRRGSVVGGVGYVGGEDGGEGRGTDGYETTRMENHHRPLPRTNLDLDVDRDGDRASTRGDGVVIATVAVTATMKSTPDRDQILHGQSGVGANHHHSEPGRGRGRVEGDVEGEDDGEDDQGAGVSPMRSSMKSPVSAGEARCRVARPIRCEPPHSITHT